MSAGNHAEHGNVQFRQEQYNVTVRGAMRGGAAGFAAAAPTAYLLHRSWAPFRALNLPVKAFFVTACTIGAGAIVADKSGLAFDREHFSDKGAQLLKRYASQEEKEWDELSTRDKALTWAKENKFAVVAGSWVASMAGTFAYIQSQPLSFSQKLVQARVYAQGLTLASLVGMAAITQIPSAGDKIIHKKQHANDHSWMDFMPQESAEKQSRQPSPDVKSE